MKKLIYLLIFLLAILVSQGTLAQDVPAKNTADTDSLQFHLLKAQTFVKQGKKEKAFKILTSIIATHPNNKEVHWWLIANMKMSPTR